MMIAAEESPFDLTRIMHAYDTWELPNLLLHSLEQGWAMMIIAAESLFNLTRIMHTTRGSFRI